jgi:hypothetical protein
MNDRSKCSSGHLRAKLGEVVEAAPNTLAKRLFKTSLSYDNSSYINSQTENDICIIFVWQKMSLVRQLFPYMDLPINLG